MMYFKIELAEVVIGIHSLYDTLKKFCRDYITETEQAEFEIEITEEDIQKEASLAEEEYSPQYLETLAVLRKISDEMPERDRFLMHGAVISCNGKGYMFTAPSGTGKSTHINLWRKYLGESVEIINGDKPILKAEEDTVCVYGTPWAGKEGWQTNRKVHLETICFLEQGRENEIRKLTPVEALPRLLRQVHYTEDPGKAGKTLELLDRIFDNVPMYQLTCDISREAVKCSYEMLTGNPFDTDGVSDRKFPEEEEVWEELIRLQGKTFSTVKGLEFYYRINGNELFINRKKKSITRSSIDIALEKIRELDGYVSGPKKLQVFGSSYLYPVFQRIGLIRTGKARE